MADRNTSFTGYLERSDERIEVTLRISKPHKSKGEQDWYCTAHATPLLESPKQILGIDREQARDLAVQFLKQLIENQNYRLVDKKGSPVEVGAVLR